MIPAIKEIMNNFHRSEFGIKVRKAREEKNLTIWELAKKADTSKRYIEMIEEWEYPPPIYPKTIYRICKILSLDSDEILILLGKIPGNALPRSKLDIELFRKIVTLSHNDKKILLKELKDW